MQHTGIATAGIAILLLLSACQNDGTGADPQEPRTGYGNMGLATPPVFAGGTSLLGPETFPCHPAGKHDLSYGRYGVGRMRRGGLEPEKLEPDHIVIHGKGINLHGTDRVVDGGTIEMEMDEDYFEPSVLNGTPGATVTIELHNEGSRPHNLSVPDQGIDLNCGIRAKDEVTVTFPRSGVLLFNCKYTATSGMRGALIVKG